jgi:hypothetical protein
MRLYRYSSYGEYIVDSMYVAFEENGVFSGAQLYTKENGEDEVSVMARDNATNYCFFKYATDLNSQGPTFLSRNVSDVLNKSAGCLYDPRKQSWYTSAVSSNGSEVWTNIYQLESGYYGVTFAKAFYGPDNGLLGVFGADLRIDFLSRTISSTSIDSTSTKIFLIDTSGNLLGTSAGSLYDNSSGTKALLNATNSDDDTISSTATVLLDETSPSLDNLELTTQITRTALDPLTFESPIRFLGQSGLWILALTFSIDSTLSSINNTKTIAFLIGGAACLVCLQILLSLTFA